MAELLLQAAESSRLFGRTFRLQVFLQVSLRVLLQQSLEEVAAETLFMNVIIHEFMIP
jgi:hypothetical protein